MARNGAPHSSPSPAGFDSARTAALVRALRERVGGEVRFDAGSRGAYSTDASNYRQVPIGVVVPRSVEAGAAAVGVCAEFGAPVLSRGGGTSLAGQCTDTAVVIDWTKYCDRLVSLDAERRRCVVEPGIVLDDLNRQLGGERLKFGPKPAIPGDERAVLLWPDTFTNHFHPGIARAAVRLLEDAGFRVAVPVRPVCCGLTWISTGQLATAAHVLQRTVEVLRPWIAAGTPVIGLEPSCTAVFRSDAPDLFPEDLDVERLAGLFRTPAEQLVGHAPEGWRPPAPNRRATVQTHCHQHAVLKDDADRELMRRAGLDAEVLDAGCCGLAGNFGFERGHQELSMDIGELGVLPAVRRTPPPDLVLAEALALRLDGPLPADHPERAVDRPAVPARDARLAGCAVAALGVLGGAAAGAVLRHRGSAARAPAGKGRSVRCP